MAWRAAARYVAGGSVDDAMRVVAELDAQGVTASIDQIGESVEDIRVARQVADDYVGLAGRLADTPRQQDCARRLSSVGRPPTRHMSRSGWLLRGHRLNAVPTCESAGQCRALC
jgi:hypothetical protein